jgi:hypothetical protein
MDGTLRLRVHSDTFALQTLHTNLKARQDLIDEEELDDEEETDASQMKSTRGAGMTQTRFASVAVDARHFWKMLSVDGNAVMTVLCCT